MTFNASTKVLPGTPVRVRIHTVESVMSPHKDCSVWRDATFIGWQNGKHPIVKYQDDSLEVLHDERVMETRG